MENADIAFTTMIMKLWLYFQVGHWVTSQVYTNGIPHIGDLDVSFQETLEQPRVSKSASLALDDAVAIVASAGAIFVAGRGKSEIFCLSFHGRDM